MTAFISSPTLVSAALEDFEQSVLVSRRNY